MLTGKVDLTPYSVYGVKLISDLPLRLPPANGGVCPVVVLERGAEEALVAARGKLPPPTPGEWQQHAMLADGSIFMRWADWLEFIVSADGQRVQYGWLAEGPFEPFEAYIANFAVSAALIQQGEELLHATVVEFGSRTFGFLGPSGAGKSTLAAFLLSRGARLVTDDMLRITFEGPSVRAQPGPLRLKLFQEPAARYLQGAICSGRWNPLAGKYIFEPDDPTAARGASPLHALFWLDVPNHQAPKEQVKLDRLSGLELFKVISGSTMNSRINTPDRIQRQFTFARRIAQLIPVYSLAYERSPDVFGRVAEVLDRVSQ